MAEDTFYCGSAKAETKHKIISARCLPNALFQITEPLIDIIHDYPTLVCLSLSCHHFYERIQNSRTILHKAFMNLERDIPLIDRTHQLLEALTKYHSGACSPLQPSGDFVRLMTNPRKSRVKYRHYDFIYNYDIFRYKTCQLPTFDWMPCYGCFKIKRRKPNFFADQVREYSCLNLLGCKALNRRCVHCNIGDPLRFKRTYCRYLQGMPKPISGFRSRCYGCRKIEWILKRPRRKQEALKLCNECYERWKKRDTEVLEELQQLLRVFAGFPIVPGRIRKTRQKHDEGDGLHGDKEHWSLQRIEDEFRSRTLFEVLTDDAE